MVSMTKDPGYLFPVPVDPGETVCFKVYVPRHTLYLAAFWSSYEYLAQWSAWARDEYKYGADVAALWREHYERARAEYIEGGGCVPDFRINSETCLLEVNCSDDPEAPDWQPVFTPAYDPSMDEPIPVPPYPDEPPEGESNQCLAAANTTAMLENGATNFTNLLELDSILGAIVAFLYTFLSSVVTVTLSQLWLGLGVAYGAFNAETIGDDLAAFEWDELKCLLFIYYQPDGTMTGIDWATVLDIMQDKVVESGNQIWLLIAMVWGLMGTVGAAYATHWGNITTADCDDCGWEHTFEGEELCEVFAQTGVNYTGYMTGSCVPPLVADECHSYPGIGSQKQGWFICEFGDTFNVTDVVLNYTTHISEAGAIYIGRLNHTGDYAEIASSFIDNGAVDEEFSYHSDDGTDIDAVIVAIRTNTCAGDNMINSVTLRGHYPDPFA